jgi:hypothetical protein
MNRTSFLPRHLEYLFSFDLDLGLQRRKHRERAPLAVITSETSLFDQDSASQVYNALGDANVLGEPAITGYVECAQDRIEFSPGNEFGEISGRIVIRTPDHSLIESSYAGVVRTRHHWGLIRQEYANDSGPAEVEARAQFTTHFETGAAKYRWLVEHQCVGFGNMRLEAGEPTWASFDIYALAQGVAR